MDEFIGIPDDRIASHGLAEQFIVPAGEQAVTESPRVDLHGVRRPPQSTKTPTPDDLMGAPIAPEVDGQDLTHDEPGVLPLLLLADNDTTMTHYRKRLTPAGPASRPSRSHPPECRPRAPRKDSRCTDRSSLTLQGSSTSAPPTVTSDSSSSRELRHPSSQVPPRQLGCGLHFRTSLRWRGPRCEFARGYPRRRP